MISTALIGAALWLVPVGPELAATIAATNGAGADPAEPQDVASETLLTADDEAELDDARPAQDTSVVPS